MPNSEPEAWRGQSTVCVLLCQCVSQMCYFPLAWRICSTSPVECEFIIRQELVAGSELAGSPGVLLFTDPGDGQSRGTQQGMEGSSPALTPLTLCIPQIFLSEEPDAGNHITGRGAADRCCTAAGHPASPHKKRFCVRAGR